MAVAERETSTGTTTLQSALVAVVGPWAATMAVDEANFSADACCGEEEEEEPPWSNEKLSLPVSCRSRAMNERDPEARAGFAGEPACAAEN